MTTLLDVQGRRTVGYLVNKSGGSVAKGDVIVVDSSNDEAFTTSTAGAEVVAVGVVVEANGIASNASGRIAFQGYVDLVNVNASVTRGHFGKTHTVAKQATDAGASRVLGVFCQFLTGGTTPTAMLMGQPDGVTGAGGLSGGTPALTFGTANAAGAAASGIRTDATLAIFDATVPAANGTAAAGSAGVAARRDHVHPQGSPPPVNAGATAANVGATCAVTVVAPASTSILFALIATVGANGTVSSIAQTNVTWTKIREKANGTSVVVSLWKGVPSGTGGTTVTATLAGSTTTTMVVLEWATGHGLAGTMDQVSEMTGTSAFQSTGVIFPTASNALTFVMFSNANGTIALQGPTGPFYVPLTSNYSVFGYAWTGKNLSGASIPVQTSAAWVNMIISVI